MRPLFDLTCQMKRVAEGVGAAEVGGGEGEEPFQIWAHLELFPVLLEELEPPEQACLGALL